MNTPTVQLAMERGTEGMYEKVVEYHFEVCGEVIAITEFSGDRVWVEEVEKNGQEDCHMAGVLMKEPSGWQWDEGEHLFEVYHSKMLADRIRMYINKNGLPASAE